ncbi:SLOG family protein [Sediminibacillus albus]|uniref:Uncharacterized SPBc2 prophage-derived protein YoqJ n=1 Tax=Sediminibacillus albus TaxID=407036 RepID=A0A1G8VQA1_9BACI|nr:DUF1273 domain-containing protein [Sediminibacillus albus]SDJ68134.1 Uncharacterized SPBc2 prophage-derived protein YoqJ [Sediminibacillus albus]
MDVLAVTGYKPMEMNIFKEDDPKIAYIKAAIQKKIIAFIEEGLEWVLISGQMGVELWTGEVIIELQEAYNIKLGIIPPFQNQESRWPEAIQHKYQELTSCADFFQPLYQSEYKGPFQFKAKNKWLVEKSNGCLILLDSEYPGSCRFYHEEAQLANQSNGYPIYLITPMDLDDVVQELQMEDPDYWS